MKKKSSPKKRNSTAKTKRPAARGAVRSPFKAKRILVPVDFSAGSGLALREALAIARPNRAQLTLLSVVSPPTFGDGSGGLDYARFVGEMAEDAGKELAKLAARVVRKAVPVKTLVRIGSPGREIADVAGDRNAGLIVISTHGRTGLRHVFLGSVAEHVVRHAPCPVLVIRQPDADRA